MDINIDINLTIAFNLLSISSYARIQYIMVNSFTQSFDKDKYRLSHTMILRFVCRNAMQNLQVAIDRCIAPKYRNAMIYCNT